MLPIPRTTLTDMVAAYRQSEDDIRAAYSLLVGAEQRLCTVFQSESYAFNLSTNRPDYGNPDSTMNELKKASWRALINKMGVRQAMSIQRARELEEQLSGKSHRYSGNGRSAPEELPEISEMNILAMMEQTFNSLPQMIEESVKEVFDWLRPSHWRLHYKTNQKSEWELKDKLILTFAVEYGYSKHFSVSYHFAQNLRALDNVFSMLDGKGIIKTHNGPLSDAIAAASDGTGQTEYFQFKCFHNRNLHLKFRRMDLVEKLNAVAGGMRLKNAQQKQQAA